MTACAALAEGKRDARLRVTGAGCGPACRPACRLRGALDGRRSAHRRRQVGADIIDINMGCPAKHVTGGQVGIGADARPRSSPHVDRGGSAGGRRASHAQNAVGLGRSFTQRAGTCPARRAGRRGLDHGAWPHALPILQGSRRLGWRARRQTERFDPRCRQRRHRKFRRRRYGARRFRGRCSDDRPRRAG